MTIERERIDVDAFCAHIECKLLTGGADAVKLERVEGAERSLSAKKGVRGRAGGEKA